MNKQEILSFLKENKAYMQDNFSVTSIALFGSYARDMATDDSDIDIAVEMASERKFKNFFALQRYLQNSLHKKVDIGIQSSFKPLVKESISRDLIYV